MKLIVAVDSNWGIGNKGKLLVSIPEDMKFFRGTTTGHVIVMGRKTLESFPNGNPLPFLMGLGCAIVNNTVIISKVERTKRLIFYSF